MSRTRRILALLALATIAFPAAPAQASVTVETTPTQITIDVPMELRGGTPEVIARWTRAIDQFWGSTPGSNTFCAGSREVIFRPTFRVLAPGATPTPGWTVVDVVRPAPGVFFVSSVTQGVPPIDARNRDMTASWDATASAATIAHEFGHVIGLPDEYDEVDTNHDGIRQANETTVPRRGFEDSLMAQLAGHVDERLIGLVLTGMHVDTPNPVETPGFPDGTWEGSGVLRGETSKQGARFRFDGAFDFRMTVQDGLVEQGSLTYDLDVVLTIEEGRVDVTGGGTLDLSGSSTDVEMSGEAEVDGSATILGTNVPIHQRAPAGGRFTGTASSRGVVTGDLLLEGQRAFNAAGFTGRIEGPFTAYRTSGSGRCGT